MDNNVLENFSLIPFMKKEEGTRGMKNKLEGFVTEVNQDMATVRLSEHSECAQCGSCGGTNATHIQAQNPVHAKPGQQVIIEMQDQNMIRAAFMIYMLPLIALLAGGLLGYASAYLTGASEVLLSSSGSVLLFVVCLFFIRSYDRKMRNIQSEPVILCVKN